MQHMVGVCAYGGAVWVADSYNNKIRKIDLGTGYVSTVASNAPAAASTLRIDV
jgi:hypothetical protein